LIEIYDRILGLIASLENEGFKNLAVRLGESSIYAGTVTETLLAILESLETNDYKSISSQTNEERLEIIRSINQSLKKSGIWRI
jgi:hypothetical protein